jgi:hypothetical protein
MSSPRLWDGIGRDLPGHPQLDLYEPGRKCSDLLFEASDSLIDGELLTLLNASRIFGVLIAERLDELVLVHV